MHIIAQLTLSTENFIVIGVTLAVAWIALVFVFIAQAKFYTKQGIKFGIQQCAEKLQDEDWSGPFTNELKTLGLIYKIRQIRDEVDKLRKQLGKEFQFETSGSPSLSITASPLGEMFIWRELSHGIQILLKIEKGILSGKGILYSIIYPKFGGLPKSGSLHYLAYLIGKYDKFPLEFTGLDLAKSEVEKLVFGPAKGTLDSKNSLISKDDHDEESGTFISPGDQSSDDYTSVSDTDHLTPPNFEILDRLIKNYPIPEGAHNPDNFDASMVDPNNEGWRLILKSEMDAVPEDAELFGHFENEWIPRPSDLVGTEGHNLTTYRTRTPLPENFLDTISKTFDSSIPAHPQNDNAEGFKALAQCIVDKSEQETDDSEFDCPESSDGCDHDGFPGGCERAGHTKENCPWNPIPEDAINPDQLTAEQVDPDNEGWRLCVESEKEEPPLDSEFWIRGSKQWGDRINPRRSLVSGLTYRTKQPLPPTT